MNATASRVPASMSLPVSESRLPCYEGHLFLNDGILHDDSYKCSSTAWSERWCSLEDGKLLVYKDRTAALIAPEAADFVIDVRHYSYVHQSTNSTGLPHDLILSCEPAECVNTSRLFRPKSALSLHRLQADPGPRGTAEANPRPYMASAGRVSFQAAPVSSSASSSSSAQTDGAARTSHRMKPWSNFGSGTRSSHNKFSLHNRVSTSNGSLRDTDSHRGLSVSTISSFSTSRHRRDSSDVASSGLPSPGTPLSSTFSNSSERVVVRAPSSKELESWTEAFTLTIKLHNESFLTPSPMIRQQRRASSRPSLSNLPGFRTPTGWGGSPVFPSVEGSSSFMDETTPKPARTHQSSTTSFSFAPHTSQDSQFADLGHQIRASSGPVQGVMEEADTRRKTAVRVAEDGPPRRLSIADTIPTFVSQVFGSSDIKRGQPDRKHKRSMSTASSSLSFSGSALLSSITRRNSTACAQLLPSYGADAKAFKRPESDLTENANYDPQKQWPALLHLGQMDHKPVGNADIPKPSSDSRPGTRHRRSGSVLRIGSARILAWRDNSTASERPRTEVLAGLGLDVCQSQLCDLSLAESMVLQPQKKISKGMSKFRSFRLLPKSKASDHETGSIASSRPDDTSSFPSPSEQHHTEATSSARSPSLQQIASSKVKGMSRTTSLLNLTKYTFSSFHERSSSRQSVKQTLPTPQDEAAMEDRLNTNLLRIHSPGCDFSYELVDPACEASQLASPELPSAEAMPQHSQVTRADVKKTQSVPPLAPFNEAPSISIKFTHTDDTDESFTPPFPVERILPPEHIINTFDQLRAADPTGRSCDWLSHIETATRRESSNNRTRAPLRRLASSQTFETRIAEAPRLRSSLSAWDLSGSRFSNTDRQACSNTARLEEEGTDTTVTSSLRSLPAPPRASKRRARISSSSTKSQPRLPAMDIAAPRSSTALSDLTNTRGQGQGHELPNLEKLVLDEACSRTRQLQMTPPRSSPSRRLGPRRKLSVKSSPQRIAPLA